MVLNRESQYCSQTFITKTYSKDKPWVVELDTGFI